MLLVVSSWALCLVAGWIALAQWAGYTPEELRREICESPDSDIPPTTDLDDLVVRGILVAAYMMVLHLWPVALYRRLRGGRVVGK